MKNARDAGVVRAAAGKRPASPKSSGEGAYELRTAAGGHNRYHWIFDQDCGATGRGALGSVRAGLRAAGRLRAAALAGDFFAGARAGVVFVLIVPTLMV